MKTLIITLFLSLPFYSFSQTNASKNHFIKLSSGRVLFGTGDIGGFSINIEGSKNIIKVPKPALNKLLSWQ